MTLIHYTPGGERRVTDMTDAYQGQTAILAGAAPSIKTQNLEALSRRGVLVMAMNNAALHFRAGLWCGVDDPSCFDPQILLDPNTLKFGNMAHAEAPPVFGNLKFRECPNTYFFIPEADVPWDEYLGPRRCVPWYNSTLFTAIHILYQLGVRRIILAGSDFAPARDGTMYAHASGLDPLQTKWNTDLYNSQVYDLRRLKPVFDNAGLELLDCSVNSRISQVYKHITMDEAVGLCLERFPEKPMAAGQLPHCSALATPTIQERVAKWPGYTLVAPLVAGPAQEKKHVRAQTHCQA